MGTILELLKAILFGIVEGVTEWLPVSSTGHMILLDELVKLKVSPEFYEMFEVVIQLGAIGAVLLLFFVFMLGVRVIARALNIVVRLPLIRQVNELLGGGLSLVKGVVGA